jgi:hypothetical protein
VNILGKPTWKPEKETGDVIHTDLKEIGYGDER